MAKAGERFRRINGHRYLKALTSLSNGMSPPENVGPDRHNDIVTAA